MATAPVTVNANLNFNPASVRAAGNQVQSAFGNINLPSRAVNNFNNSLGRITGQASEFDKSINAATARVFAFGAAVSIINGISTAFKALISSTIEVEKRITEIGSIIGGTAEQLGQFKTAIFDVAKNTGQTFDTVANGAAELARQGLSAEETVKRLNSALILTRVSGLDAESSVSALTAAINGFTSAGLTAEQIVNKLIAVDTAFAVSAKDLAEAFSRAGSTAEDAGVSFDQLLGLVTSVQQTTARGGAVIGNAFKSIFARLGRGTVIEDLKALGVEIDQSQNGVQKLQALATALANISDPTKANAIKELAGGVYQINIVSAALKDLSSETSVFGKASEIAGQASNEAFEKNAQLNQTLSSQINKLVQGLTELGSKIGELTLGPVIQNLLTGANKLLDILNKVFDPEEGNKLIQLFFKGIGAFIAGPGLVLVSAAFFKLFQVVSKFAAQGVRDLFKIGSEQERIKNIEGGIVALLQQDAKLRATLLSTSSTQAQKEQAVINAIKQQNALLTQQQALVNSIAAAAARAGVGGFTPTGGFTNRRGRGRFAAAGYSGNVSPEEAAMEMSAASQHGYKAGKVRKERIFDGTGSSFMGILNGAETRNDFTNASGYKSTLITPPNGFAASGFIPNFANGAARPRGSSSYSSKNIIRERIEDFPDRELRTALLTANRPATGYKASLLINGKPKDFTKEEIEDAIANKGKARFIKKQEDENRVGSSEKPLLVKAKDYALLIPNLNKKYESQRVFEPGGSGSIDQWQKVKNLNYKLTPTQLAGPQTDPANLTENEEASIAKEAMDNIIKTALSYSEKLSNPLMRGEISPQTIKTRLSQKGGNKGAYGAVQGAAGAAFEAVISQGLGIDGNDAQKLEGGDWDVPLGSVSNNLKELFAIKKPVKAADFKVSTSPSSLESYAKKILNDDKVGYKNKLGVEDDDDDKPKKTRGRGRGRASGFIPNFASGFIPNMPKSVGISGQKGINMPKSVGISGQNPKIEPWYTTKDGLKEYFEQIKTSIPEDLAGIGLVASDPEKYVKLIAEATKKEIELAKSLGAVGYDSLMADRIEAYFEDFKSSPNRAANLTVAAALKGLTKYAPGLKKIEGDDAFSNAKAVSSALLSPDLDFNKEGFGRKFIDNQVAAVGEDRALASTLRNLRKGDSKAAEAKASLYGDLINVDLLRNSSFGEGLIKSQKKAVDDARYFDILSRLNTEEEKPEDRDYIEEYKNKHHSTFASGFIPNFAALNDAISREMEAGIPRDKIYIDQDDSLKSPFNEQGLMVANPYDEPKGGKQGIKRVKGEGKNPKTHGKANAAKGFIPNYARSDAFKLFPAFLKNFGKKSSDSAIKLGKSADKLDDAANSLAKQTIFGKTKQAAGGFAKDTFSGLTSLSLFSLIPQISVEGLTGALGDAVSSLNDYSEALREEASLRETFKSDLEKEKSKDKPNESRVKDLEDLVKGSEEYSASLEADSKNVAAAAFKVGDVLYNLGDIMSVVGGKSGEDLIEKAVGTTAASQYTDKSDLDKQMGAVGGILTVLTGKAGVLANVVGTGLGMGAGYLTSQFGDSGAGGQYYNRGYETDVVDVGKAYDDATRDMRDNDAIGEFMNRGYSVPESRLEDGRRNYSSREGERKFLANLFETEESYLEETRERTSDELVNARANLYEASPENKEGARKEVDRLISKLEKLDFELESRDFEDFVDNFEKGVKARRDGEGPLAKAIREAEGKGLNARDYARASEDQIEYDQQQTKIKLEADEVRKEIDRVKDLFEQETFSFKFDVKNVRSQLERIIDDVAIGGRKTSVERAGNITELQKKVLRSSFEDEFKSNPTITSSQRIRSEATINDESSRLDNLQFKRRDELIGQTSSDKFGDLFTQLSGNLNTSGSGSLLLEKEKATAALANAKTAAVGSPDNEDAQQRVEQLTSSLSEIDSKIASRRDTAADPTLDGEVQRIKLKKVQDATKALTIGDLDEGSQKKALEDVFTNLEGLNLGDGGEGIKEEILEAAKEVSAERTKLFVDQEKARLNNELESLEKQKAILDEFVSKFNASFRENIKGTRDTFNTITKNQTPVAQNAAALSAARIGTGESSDAQIISDRLNASNRVTEVFDDANFSGMVGEEDLATFRSNTTSQIVSGGNLTALEDINEIAAENLRKALTRVHLVTNKNLQ
jgi:TP901 family phage tail tape measure protein